LGVFDGQTWVEDIRTPSKVEFVIELHVEYNVGHVLAPLPGWCYVLPFSAVACKFDLFVDFIFDIRGCGTDCGHGFRLPNFLFVIRFD